MALRGTPVARREDHALVTTGGCFVGDRVLPNMAHVGYVTSPYAHAHITAIHLDAARAAPGVIDLMVGKDCTHLAPFAVPNPDIDKGMVRPLLPIDTVRFVGEAVVAVVAETAAQLADAIELVEVDYQPLPVLVDPEVAMTSELRLFEGAASNVALHLDAPTIAADFDACEVITEVRVINNRLAPAPMEPRVAAAQWVDGRLVHYSAGQGAHPIRAALTRTYGMEASQIRVVSADVGGSFGAKGTPHPEELLLGLLSQRIGRPVRWVPPRSADMVGLHHGRGQIQYLKIGGTRDGKILAYDAHIVQDSGAYPAGATGLPSNTKAMLTGCYDIPTAGFRSDSVVTNTTPTGAYRGAGRPEAAAAIERAVDVFAAEIGMDPAEVRRRNFLQPEQFPFSTLGGMSYDCGEYEKALDMALDAAGYGALRVEQQRRRDAGDTVLLGIGLAAYVERTAGILRPDYGSVALNPDGSLHALTGSSPYGQGHHTSWAMLIADRTGVPMERIEIVHGDTDVVPRGGVTGGSRSVQSNGVAMWQAAGLLVDQARQLAADLLEANPDDVVLDATSGHFHVTGTPARFLDWSAIATAAAERDGGTGSERDGGGNERRLLHAETDFQATAPTFPFGAHVAVVEVDTETGRVTLQRLIACDDAGVILNPLLADGQVHGGLAQGAAQALLEEFVYDADGNPLTANFADFAVISAAELPSFERIVLETPTPRNELGAKGIGESGTVGATPAVQNAVVDALAHLGIRHLDMPLTSERVWRAVNAAG
ncbi:MAG: xanthine dehydrogenase family protein molybdopterin-binding subunit [Acidimicrobiales bacterium]